MRKLTELQLSVLAAVRDDEVRPFVNYKIARFTGYTPIGHRAHGFDVTCQIRSLRKRRLLKFNRTVLPGIGGSVYELSEAGEKALEGTEF